MSLLVPASADLFFGKGDPEDRRLGEIVKPATLEQIIGLECDLLIVGVPDDRGIVVGGGRSGAAQGPTEIRRALYRLTVGDEDQLSRFRCADIGDISPEATVDGTHDRVMEIVQTAFRTCSGSLLLLGGGHDIAYPHLAAFIEAAPADATVGIINVDAHFDVRPVRDAITSGTPFRRLLDKGDARFSATDFVAVGTQPQANSPAHRQYLIDLGAKIIPFDEIMYGDMVEAFNDALSDIVERVSSIGVSFDMDAIRMADALGVSAPSPIGVSAKEAVDICRSAGAHPLVRTLGIYETSPPLDNGSAIRTAALMSYGFMLGIAEV